MDNIQAEHVVRILGSIKPGQTFDPKTLEVFIRSDRFVKRADFDYAGDGVPVLFLIQSCIFSLLGILSPQNAQGIPIPILPSSQLNAIDLMRIIQPGLNSLRITYSGDNLVLAAINHCEQRIKTLYQ